MNFTAEAIHRVALCGGAATLALCAGCAAMPAGSVGLNGQTLLGMDQTKLRSCAGPPLQSMVQSNSTMLVYYREAAMFEESFVVGKGSKAGYHHGCWASLVVEGGRVTGVEFRPVPEPDADTHECQEIFAGCTS